MRRSRPLRTTGTDAERRLLAAGLAEWPDDQSVRRAAEALRIVPRAVMFGGALALALRSSRWTSLLATALLPLGGAGAVGLVAFAVVHHVTDRRPHAPAAPAVLFEAPAAAPIAPRTEGSGSVLPASASARADGEPPARAAAAPGPARRPAARSSDLAATVFADRLRAQAQIIDRARASVASGNTAAALATLDDYDRRFPRSSLSEESSLLRIEALARGADPAAAASLAAHFLQTYPASLHAERVRAILSRVAP
jgi:hypothetical protein